MEWTQDGVATAVGWDGAGNRVSFGADSYLFDERNRLLSSPAGVFSYTARGTVASAATAGGSVSYQFDALGRLDRYDNTVSYAYDGLDRVATRGTDSFSYGGLGLDPVADGSFVYSRSPGGRLVGMSDGVAARLVGHDRHGDVTHLFTGPGVVSDTQLFDPFGAPLAATGPWDVPVGFQGDWTDPSSGHVWMGARWYEGGWASFLSRDTVFGELRTPISLNRYTYAWASPLRYWDPDGRRAAAVVAERGSGSLLVTVRLARAACACGWRVVPVVSEVYGTIRTRTMGGPCDEFTDAG